MAAHIIVFGNEKGGSGKSTNCMHVTTALVRMGFTVGALDLDLRQRSFSRYCENRKAYAAKSGLNLALPEVVELPEIAQSSLLPGENIYDRRLTEAVNSMEGRFDFIVIDCPGSHTRLSQVAHSLADTLVTPLNDSFIDFDLLARIEPETQKVLGPSVYSEMVWQARQLPRGLTLLDLGDIGIKNLNISNVAARQEVRELVKALRLPGVEINF